eukprot:2210334-Pyramimonas_sp.AAC.1
MKDKHGEYSQEWHAERVAAVANFTVMCASQADEIYYIDDEVDDPMDTKCFYEGNFHDLEHYLAETTVDIMEIYGGEAGTTRSSVRLGLRGGRNFDIVTGCDLALKEDARQLWY